MINISQNRRKSVATVPRDYAGQERKFADSIAESVDTLAGRRGDQIDRAVTFRDLLDANILQLAVGQTLTTGPAGPPLLVNPTPPPSAGGVEIPPKPFNLNATGGFGFVRLSWQMRAYRGFGSMEIYRHPTDDITAATAAGPIANYNLAGDAFFDDTLVASGVQYYYWVRGRNIDGVAGPFNQSAGTTATTALDYIYVSELIDDILADDVSGLGLTTALGANTTAIELTDTKYAVKTDLNNHISGFGLISDVNLAGATTSAFIVAADRFAISAPFNANSSANSAVGENEFPFKVFTTNHTLLDDEGNNVLDAEGNNVVIPAGAYINDAFIHDAQITTATIGTGTITTANIATGNITTANIADSITSVGFDPFNGVDGWGLFTRDGPAGSQTANSGGLLWATDAIITGNITATSLNLSAAALIKTLQIDGDAVTVPSITEFSQAFPSSGSEGSISSGKYSNWNNTATDFGDLAPVLSSGAPFGKTTVNAEGGRLMVTANMLLDTEKTSDNLTAEFLITIVFGTPSSSALYGSMSTRFSHPDQGSTQTNIIVPVSFSGSTNTTIGVYDAVAGSYDAYVSYPYIAGVQGVFWRTYISGALNGTELYFWAINGGTVSSTIPTLVGTNYEINVSGQLYSFAQFGSIGQTSGSDANGNYLDRTTAIQVYQRADEVLIKTFIKGKHAKILSGSITVMSCKR